MNEKSGMSSITSAANTVQAYNQGYYHGIETGKTEAIEITLRDQFAMACITGMLANPGRFDAAQSLVDYAFELANDMISARKLYAQPIQNP